MKYIVIIILILTIASPLLASFTIKKNIGIQRQLENDIYYFYKDKVFKSYFYSPLDNLFSISLKLKNPTLRNKKSIKFKLYTNDQEIREIAFNGSNVTDGGWVRLTFEEIVSSKGERFEFELTSFDSLKDDSVGIQLNSVDQLPAIITYHRVNSRLNLIIDLYTNLVKKIWSDRLFLVFFTTILISAYFGMGKIKVFLKD